MKEEALQKADAARPERVTRPDMSNALALCADSLTNHATDRTDHHNHDGAQ